MSQPLIGSSYNAAINAELYTTRRFTKTSQRPLIPSAELRKDGSYTLSNESAESFKKLFEEALFFQVIDEYNKKTYHDGNIDPKNKPINVRDAIALRNKHANIDSVDTFMNLIDEVYGDSVNKDEIFANAMSSVNTMFAENGMSFSTIAGRFDMKYSHTGYINLSLCKSKKDTAEVKMPVWKFPISPIAPSTRNFECLIDGGMNMGYVVSAVEKPNFDRGTDIDRYDTPYNTRFLANAMTDEKIASARVQNMSTMYRNLQFCPQFMTSNKDVQAALTKVGGDSVTFKPLMSINDVLGISIFKPYCDDAKMAQLASAFTLNKASHNEPYYKTKYADVYKRARPDEEITEEKSRLHYRNMMSRASSLIKYLDDHDISFDVNVRGKGFVELQCHEIVGNSKQSFNITVLDINNLSMGVAENGRDQQFVSRVGEIVYDGIQYNYTTYRPTATNFRTTGWLPSLKTMYKLIDMVRNNVDVTENVGASADAMFSQTFKGSHNEIGGLYFLVNSGEDVENGEKPRDPLTIFAFDTTAKYNNSQFSGLKNFVPEANAETDIENSVNIESIVIKPSASTLISNSRLNLLKENRVVVRDPDVDEADYSGEGIVRFLSGFGPLTEEQIAIVNAMGLEYGSHDKYGHLIDIDGNIIDDKYVLTHDENSCVLAENKETGKQEFVSTGLTADDIEFVLDEDNHIRIKVNEDAKSVSPYFESKYRVIRNASNQTSRNYGLAGNMLVSLINRARVEVKSEINLDGLMDAYNKYKTALDNGESAKFTFEYSNDNAINLLQKQYVRVLKALAEGRNTAIEYTKWDCTNDEKLTREKAIKDYVNEGKPYDGSLLTENDILILDHASYVEDAEGDEEIRKALQNHIESYCNEYFGNPFEHRILPNGNISDDMGRFSPHRLKELVNINIIQNNSALPAIHTLVELMQMSGLDEHSFTEDAVFMNKFTRHAGTLDYKDMFDLQYSGTFDEDGNFHMDPECLHMKKWENWKNIVEADAQKLFEAKLKAHPDKTPEEVLKALMKTDFKYTAMKISKADAEAQRTNYGRSSISFLGPKFTESFYSEYAETIASKTDERVEELIDNGTDIRYICPVNDVGFDSPYKEVGKWIRDAVISSGCIPEMKEIDGKMYYDINIDAQTGIATYKYRKNTNKVDHSLSDVIIGSVGPIFLPEKVTNIDGTEIEVIKTRFKVDMERGNTKVIVPGYEAYISANDVSHKTAEERIRLVGFEQRLRNALTSKVKSDCINDNMTKSIMSDRTLDSVYSNTADTTYNINFFNRMFCPMDWPGATEEIAKAEMLKAQIEAEQDPNVKADLQNDLDSMKDNRDLFAYKARQASKRVRLPNSIKEQAALHAKARFDSLKPFAKHKEVLGNRKASPLELADFNDMDMVPVTSKGYFDMDIIGQAKNQSCVRYLCEGAKVNPDGSIVNAMDTEEYQNADDETKKQLLESPLKRSRYLRYCKFNPQDRIQMAASQLMDATECINNVTFAQSSLFGFTFDDGFVISKRIAQRAKIYHGGDEFKSLNIEDKMSECNGNKGVTSMIVDPSWTDDDIDALNVHRNKKVYLKKLRDIFKANPTLDVIAAPASALSRFNAGLGRSLLDNHEEMVKNGEETTLVIPAMDGHEEVRYEGGISRTDIIITNITADHKVHIYDAPGEGRKMSGLLSWAFMSNGCEKIVNSVYKNSDAGVHNFMEGLRGLGVILDEEGRFAIDNTAVEDMNIFDINIKTESPYTKDAELAREDIENEEMTEEDFDIICSSDKSEFDSVIFDKSIAKSPEFMRFYEANGGKSKKVSLEEYRNFIGQCIDEGKSIPVKFFNVQVNSRDTMTDKGKEELLKFVNKIHTEGGYIKSSVDVNYTNPDIMNIGNYVQDGSYMYLPVVSPSLRMDMIQTLNTSGDGDNSKSLNTLTSKNDISMDYMKLYSFLISYEERRAMFDNDLNILKSLRIKKVDEMAVPEINTNLYIDDSKFDFDERHGRGKNNAKMKFGDTVLLHTGATRFYDSQEIEDNGEETISLGEWTENTLMQGIAWDYDDNGMPTVPGEEYNKFTSAFISKGSDDEAEPDLANGGLTVAIQQAIMSDLMGNNREIVNFVTNKKNDSPSQIEFKKNLKDFFESACGISQDDFESMRINKASRARLLNDDGSVNVKAVESLSYLAKHDCMGGIFKTFAQKQFLSDGLNYCDYTFLKKDEFMHQISKTEFTKSILRAANNVFYNSKKKADESVRHLLTEDGAKAEAIRAAAVFHNGFNSNTPSDEIARLTENSINRMASRMVKDGKVKGEDAELYVVMMRLQKAIRHDQNAMIGLSSSIGMRWSRLTQKILDAQFNGKKNGIREGIVRKRMDLSATSVICEDPSLPIDAIGVNMKMQKALKLRSYETSMDRVDALMSNISNDARRITLNATPEASCDEKLTYKRTMSDVKDMIEDLADYCRIHSIKNALWADAKSKDINANVDREVLSKAIELREHILDTLLTDKCTPNERHCIRHDLMQMATDFSESRDYVVVWRDPVLRPEGIKYMKVYTDDMCAGVTINPIMDKGFDMDFDGDTVALHTILSSALHKEAMANLRIDGKNIADGRDISYEFGHDYDTDYRVYGTIMQDGLDLASAESKGKLIHIPYTELCDAIVDMAQTKMDHIKAASGDETEKAELISKYGDIIEHINTEQRATLTTIREAFTWIASEARKEYERDPHAMKTTRLDTCVELMNGYANAALANECGTDVARYGSLKDHIAALGQMVEHGVKGSNKKLKSYLEYMGVQNIPEIIDENNELHVDKITGLNAENNITHTTIMGTQKAQSVKSVGTGVAGELTIDATKQFFDLDSESKFYAILDVAELTSQITQSTLQAKHDPVEALTRYKAISGPAKDLFTGVPLKKKYTPDGEAFWTTYSNEEVEQLDTEELKRAWVDTVVEFFEDEDGLNIKPVNKFNLENVANLVFAEDRPGPTTFFGIGYQSGGILPRLNEAIENNAPLFEGRTKVYASDKFLSTHSGKTEAEAEDLEATQRRLYELQTQEEEEEALTFSTQTTECNAIETARPDPVDEDYEDDSGEENEGLDGASGVA